MRTTLHIRNLPADVDSVELGRLFAEYGTVCDAQIVTDEDTRQSTGSGSVQMSCEEEALRAMAALDGSQCADRVLIVRQAGQDEPLQTLGPQEAPLGPRPGGFGDRGGKRSSWGHSI